MAKKIDVIDALTVKQGNLRTCKELSDVPSYEELTDKQKEDIDSVETVVHILKIFRKLSQERPKRLKSFVWKHDKYFTGNTWKETAEQRTFPASINGSFLLKKAKDKGIPNTMQIFCRDRNESRNRRHHKVYGRRIFLRKSTSPTR